MSEEDLKELDELDVALHKYGLIWMVKKLYNLGWRLYKVK